jgi:hypothetical protein
MRDFSPLFPILYSLLLPNVDTPVTINMSHFHEIRALCRETNQNPIIGHMQANSPSPLKRLKLPLRTKLQHMRHTPIFTLNTDTMLPILALNWRCTEITVPI